MAAAQLEAAALLRRFAAMSRDTAAASRALAARPRVASCGGRAARFAALVFASLPPAVALQIFALLPADARARAALVCRGWRDAVAEPSVWTRLDLSPASGVTVAVTNAVLRGAAARARGRLAALVLNNCETFSDDALEEVAQANAGSSLHFLFDDSDKLFLGGAVDRLALSAPNLRVFYVDVTASSVADATRLLCNDAHFHALRLRC